MSSLDTLLEAAKFVECTDTTENGARAPDPPEFHHYAKPAPIVIKRSNSCSDKSDNGEDGRDRKKQAGAGTREVHNKLEKNRRAHLKECFDNLKQQIPNLENHNKVSNLSILRGAYRYIQVLKRRETDLEHEMNEVARKKIFAQMKIAALQRELEDMDICVDVSHFMPPNDEDTRSVSTATAHNGSPIMSEEEVEEEVIVETNSFIDSSSQILNLPHTNQSPQLTKQMPPPPNPSRNLSFCNVIVTSPALPPTQTVTTASPSVQQTSMKSITKPLFTLPMKSLNSSVLKGSHTVGSASSNNKTIAAMLNTSTQSLLGDNFTGAKLSISAPELRTLKSTPGTVQPQPVSLLSAGGLSLVTLANQGSSTTSSIAVSAPNQQQAQTINAKIPVTQILQKTIAQRVQLQLQKQLQQQHQQQPQQQQATATLVVGTTATTPSAPTITVTQVSGSLPQVITMNTNALRPVVSALKTVPQIRQAVALNHQVLPSAFTLNTAQSLLSGAATTTTTTTANSQPITLATLNKLASTTTTTTTNTLTLSTTRNAALINQLAGLTTSASTPGLAGINLATVKPVLTLPITQIPAAQIMSQQMTTLQQLMSQAVANKTVSLQTTPAVSASTTAANPAGVNTDSVSGPAILTPVQASNLTAIPVTQFLPINVVQSQGASQATALNQTSITNTALNAQVLKSLGLPILQQSFSLPIKPLVVVSMPSKVTTANAAATDSSTPSTPAVII